MKKLIVFLFLLLFVCSSSLFAGSIGVSKTVTSSTPASYSQYDDDWGHLLYVHWYVQVSAVATNYSACALAFDQLSSYQYGSVCMGSGEYGTKSASGYTHSDYGPVVGYQINVYSGASVLEIYATAQASW